MKKITLLLILFTVSFGFSQTELLNLPFDAVGSESIWTPIADAAAKPEEVTIAFNASGNGTGATELTGVNADGVGGRAYIFRYDNNTFDFGTSGTLSISMDLKIDQALAGTNLQFETQVSKVGGGVLVVTNQNLQNDVTLGSWTTLTFDMTPTPSEFNNVGTELYFFFNMAAGAFVDAGGTIFVDNIIMTGGAPPAATCADGIQNGDETGVDCGGPDCDPCAPTAPTDAPTAPTALAGDVISLFSDEYTDLAATWNPNWGQSTTVTDETIASNPVKKYSNFTFSGIEPTGGTIDATSAPAKTHINVDYWTSDATELKIKLVDYRGDGAWGADNIEVEITKPITAGAWGTLSIALSEFTTANPSMILSDIGQLVLSATGATNSVYIDNLYIVNIPTAGLDDLESVSFNVYPNPSNNVWNIKTNSQVIKTIQVFDILGKQVLSLNPNSENARIDASGLTKGLYFAQINTEAGTNSVKLIKN